MLQIDYYSDILCIWAWIAQVRNEQLQQDFSDQIAIHPHAMNLFGDTQTRIGEGWKAKGGFAAFAEHVQQAAKEYPEAVVHTEVWRQVRPKSSMPAHLMLSAIALLTDSDTALAASKALRQAFFVEARDISEQSVLFEVLAPFAQANALQRLLADGSAYAALAGDYQQADKLRLQGSPSWLLNGGRQTLFGNVGYRVLSANVEQLLKRPTGEASWC